MADRTPRPSTGGASFGPSTGSLVAQEMRQARADLGRHIEACRYCKEFAALCPIAVRLFIQWRGKPPAFEYVLGGAAWLDGHPQGMTPELAAEAEPGPAWAALKGEKLGPMPLYGQYGFKLVKAAPHAFGPGKVHFRTGEKNVDGLWPTLCRHPVFGNCFEGQQREVTCLLCRPALEKRRNRPLRGEQLGLPLA